jgi:hypothetical protein
MKKWPVALWLIVAAVFLAACGEADDRDRAPATDDDQAAPDDDGGGSDDDDDDQTPFGPPESVIYIVYGYPGLMERPFVRLYLQAAGFARDGEDRWVYAAGTQRWTVIEGRSVEALRAALSTEGAHVIFTGHSNFGLGPVFVDWPFAEGVEAVEDIGDFFSMGSEHVAIQYRYLVEDQKYPNFIVKPGQIAVHPANYLTAALGLERFVNTDGVGIGETFGDVQGEGLDQYHYHAPLGTPFDWWIILLARLIGLNLMPGLERLIVADGASELPDLKYKTLLWKSCESGLYFLDNLQHGLVFYTMGDVSMFIPTVWLYVAGLIGGQSWDAILANLNALDDLYEYIDFAGDNGGRRQAGGAAPPVDVRRLFLRAMGVEIVGDDPAPWIDKLREPRINVMRDGEPLDNSGDLLAARWALAAMGEDGLLAILAKIDEAEPAFKTNLLSAATEFRDTRVTDALRGALGDDRVVPRLGVATATAPDRVCDAAQRGLARIGE